MRPSMPRLIGPLSVFALAACAPLAVTTTTTGTTPVGASAVGGSPRPAAPQPARPGAITSARPSFAPAVSLSPSAAPATPTPEPSPTPLPSPPIVLSEPHEAIRNSLSTKLAGLARIGFIQTQGTLLSNNAAGVLNNNGAGIISNSAAGVISDKGLGYRVAQSAEAVTTTPLEGEALAINYLWADNSELMGYYKPETFSPDKPDLRRVVTNAGGHGTRETLRTVFEAWPNHLPKDYQDSQIQAGDDGRFLCNSVARLTTDATGSPLTVDIAPDTMRWNDTRSGIEIDVSNFSLSYPNDLVTYGYRFAKLDRVEKGTITKLRRGFGTQVFIDLLHPENMGDVESRLEKPDGTVIFTKSVKVVDGVQVFTYDMQGGLKLKFDRQDGIKLLGKLLIDDHEEADAVLERRNGAQIFSVSFPEDKDHPIVVGFGSYAAPTDVGPPAASWAVTTVAGSGVPGSVDGVGNQAAFRSLVGLVPSRLRPNRFYASDEAAHDIRLIDVAGDGTVSVSTYAGTGAQGAADGPAAAATFNAPLGLAVGADDTLYVADSGNRKIRKISPTGVVSTIAGTGAAGAANGAANQATFLAPAGLAIDDSDTLYISDAAAHTIRRLTAGVVDTFAGTAGQAGLADGLGAAARFDTPAGLAVTGTGELLVADSANHSLRKIVSTGAVTTLAGNANTDLATLDGVATQSCLFNIRSIAIGPSGTPYLGTDNIRMLRSDGKIGSYAGAHVALSADGTHTDASFANLQGMAFGPGNVLYVADGTRLRAVTPKNAPTP